MFHLVEKFEHLGNTMIIIYFYYIYLKNIKDK